MTDTTIKLSKKYSELLERLLETLDKEWKEVKPQHVKSKKSFIEYLIATYILENQLNEFKKYLE